MYSINITDDVALANIDRFLGDWHNAEAIYFVDPKYPADSLVSRLNLKRYTHSVFLKMIGYGSYLKLWMEEQ